MMYLIWTKHKDGMQFFHLISTSFYVLIHVIGYGSLSLLSLAFLFTIFLPDSYENEIKLIVTFVLFLFFIYLTLIQVGKELVIDQESKRIGKVHSNMLKNMYWGTPAISWRLIDHGTEVHLQRLFHPGDEEVPGITSWKLIVKCNGADLVLLDTDGERFMNIMSKISYKIAMKFAIPYVDETTSNTTWINGPLIDQFQDMTVKIETIDSSSHDHLTQYITGSEYNPEFYTFGYRLFTVVAAIFLILGIFSQESMMFFYSLGILSLVVAGMIYNNSEIADKITIENGRILVSKQSKIYSRRKEAMPVSEILTIQHSEFAGRNFVEIIGSIKRFALFGDYIQPEADQMIGKLTNLVAEIA